jgi:hypothetical protein
MAVLEKNSRDEYLLVPLIYELCSEYEKNRKIYKDFASFIPHLLTNVKERLDIQ